MRLRRLAGFWLSLALAGCVQPPPPPVQPAPPPAPRVQVAPQPTAMLAVLDDYVRSGKVAGIVVGIGYGDAPARFFDNGRLSFDEGAARVDSDSLWRIYSMTKPITAMAAMMLIEDGKIRLDQPVSDFIPAFRTMRVLDDPNGTTLASHPAKHAITIRNLLTHTAGLGYSIVTTGPLLDEYTKLGINPAQLGPTLEPAMRLLRAPTLREFADRTATLPLIAEPGTKWSYSISLDILGRVIEVASGMPFDQFLQQRIFDPLRMTSTWFRVPQAAAPRLTTNYFYAGPLRLPLDPGAGSVWLRPPDFPYGGAGLVSSARDYDRFLRMLLSGGVLDGVRVMKPETVALAMSDLLPDGADTTMLRAMTGFSGRVGFGAGGSVNLDDSPGQPSKGSYGWGGMAGTFAWIDPVRKMRGVVMVNYMPPDHWPLRSDLARAMFADLAR